MFSIEFTSKSLKELKKLPKGEGEGILGKLEYYLSNPNPLVFASRIINSKAGEYRYRIGDYRVIFDLEDTKIIVLEIGHRRDIYR